MEGLAGGWGGPFTAVFWGSRTTVRRGTQGDNMGAILIGYLVFHTSEPNLAPVWYSVREQRLRGP